MQLENCTPEIEISHILIKHPDVNRPALQLAGFFDYFDVSVPYGGDYRKAYEKVKCPFLVVSFSSDWLFPEYQSRNMARMLLENGNDVTFCNIQSSYGHDAFLLEFETLGKLLTGFLTNIAQEGGTAI